MIFHLTTYLAIILINSVYECELFSQFVSSSTHFISICSFNCVDFSPLWLHLFPGVPFFWGVAVRDGIAFMISFLDDSLLYEPCPGLAHWRWVLQHCWRCWLAPRAFGWRIYFTHTHNHAIWKHWQFDFLISNLSLSCIIRTSSTVLNECIQCASFCSRF